MSYCLQQGVSPDRIAKSANPDDSTEYVNISITPGDTVDINLLKDKVSTSSEESSPSLSRRRRSATSPSVRYCNIARKLQTSSDFTSTTDISSRSPEQKSVGETKPKVMVRDQYIETHTRTHACSYSRASHTHTHKHTFVDTVKRNIIFTTLLHH